jgi:aspartate aminotransferase
MVNALLDEVRVAVLPGSDFYMPATSLGVRVAGVDFDGSQALETWPGYTHVTDEYFRSVSGKIEQGCERIAKFVNNLE